MREQDFPDLGQIYLDSACMSLRPEAVIEAVSTYYTEYPGCPGRSAHSVGEDATEAYEDARATIASFLGTEPSNLVMTSGTTEAINTVAHAFSTDRVVLSDREHNSNLVPWQQQDRSIEIISTSDGFDLETFKETVEDGDLVSMVHVSNLDGYELPIETIIDIAQDAGAYTLLDAAQSIPHQPVDVTSLEADFVAFSGHKMLGPSGTGGLYVADRVKDDLEPFMTGGGAVTNTTYNTADFDTFPACMEAGLPNIAGIIGLGTAASYLNDIGMNRIEQHERELTKKMRKGLQRIDGVEIIGKEGTGVLSFRIDGVDPNQTALMLDQRDIAVRSGMHCVHSWFNEHEEQATVRASLHLYNTENDIEQFLDAVSQIALLA